MKLTNHERTVLEAVVSLIDAQGTWTSLQVSVDQTELAESLGSTQPSVSRTIGTLCEKLGSSFAKGTRGTIKLSPELVEQVKSKASPPPEVVEPVQEVRSAPAPKAAPPQPPRPVASFTPNPRLPSMVEASSWMMRNLRDFEFDVLKEAGAYIPPGQEAREVFMSVRKQLITLLDLPIAQWTVPKVLEAGRILVEEIKASDQRESFVNVPELNDRPDTSPPVDTIENWFGQLMCQYPGTGPRSRADANDWHPVEGDETWVTGEKTIRKMVRTKYGFDVMLWAIKMYRRHWGSGGGNTHYIKSLTGFLKEWPQWITPARRDSMMLVEDYETMKKLQETRP